MYNASEIKEKWEILHDEIRGLTDRKVRVVAVTKYYPAEIFKICSECGIHEIGENRIQDLIEKNEAYPEERSKLKIHFIGSIQSNKVRFLNHNADFLDTLSSESTIEKINDRWEEGKKLKVLLQINCTNEEQKSGLPSQDYNEILNIAKLCLKSPKIELEGVMTMGPTPAGNFGFENKDYLEETRNTFLKAKEINNSLENDLGIPLPRLSMGMTHDYPIAIECGATEIRLGSYLFG